MAFTDINHVSCQTLQVLVPSAEMEEILPAARLLSRATSVTPSDYEQAKRMFLEGLERAKKEAQVRKSLRANRKLVWKLELWWPGVY